MYSNCSADCQFSGSDRTEAKCSPAKFVASDRSLAGPTMPPKAKLGVPAKGKWKSASSYFVLKPAKTEAEETAERTEVEERKRFAKEARERTVAVLASLGIAAAAEPRSAGRPTSQQLWEDGWRRQTLGAALPLCSTQCACGQPLSKLQ